jgi:hypothetical protein
LSIFRKSIKKIPVSWRSHKNNKCITWRPMYIYDNISLKSAYNKSVSNQLCGQNENTHFAFNNFFPSKIVPFVRKCEKNAVEPDRPQVTI